MVTLEQAQEIAAEYSIDDVRDITDALDQANGNDGAYGKTAWEYLVGYLADMAHVSFMETREAARFEQNYR